MSSSTERHEIARALMKKFPPLPSLSTSGMQLLSAMGARRVTTTTLAQIIERDVALAANVHKIANSPFYGKSRSIATIERALVLLGVDVIRNIALASSVSRVFRGGRLTPEFHIGTLWRHSLAVATLSEAMAQKFAPAQRERAFIAGLLHDIGFLVELSLWPIEFVTLVRELDAQSLPSHDLLQIEVDRFGASHDDFGRVLLDQWLLPPHLGQATAAHHRMDSDAGDHTLAALVLLADQLSVAIGAPLLTDAPSDASRHAALGVVGTSWASLEEMATGLRPQIDSLSGYLAA